MKKALRIVIPEGLAFPQLNLTRDAETGSVVFDWAPIDAICGASGLDPDIFRAAPEDNVAGLIIAWYAEHRRRGGGADPVADDLIAEAAAEDALGGGLSYPPGRG